MLREETAKECDRPLIIHATSTSICIIPTVPAMPPFICAAPPFRRFAMLGLFAYIQSYAYALRSALIIAALAFLAGCATSSNPPAPKIAATPNYNYIIGPGDQLSILVWRNPDLSTTVPVRPDGKISVSLVDDLPAMGKDPTTLSRDIEKVLAKYVREPIVTVIVL